MMRYLIVFLFLLAAAVAHADTTITYQGQLQDASGPVTGTPGMEFRLYDSLVGGSQVGDALVKNAVPVTDGLFQVDLDFGEQAYAGGLWLAIIVEGSSLEPRQAITGAPFAISAAPGNGSNWAVSGSDIHYSDGNVGIGTSSPSVALDVIGSAKFGATSNQATGQRSFVGGGSGNIAGGLNSFIAGGTLNTASGSRSFVGVGVSNTASAINSFVAGGSSNTASEDRSFVGGGQDNTASGLRSFVGGGSDNIASAENSIVSGGVGNTASAPGSFSGGGDGNAATGTASAAIGGVGNEATGFVSFVAGGANNNADGFSSFAAGRRAKAEQDGTFVWADNTDATFASTGINQFLIRAGGGVGIGTNAPNSQLHVNAPAGDNPMRAQVDGQTAFAVDSSGGVAIGGFTAFTPASGLYVAGRTGLGTAIPQRDLHIKQSSTSNGEIGLQIERSGANTNNWAFYVATSDNLGFRYNDTLVARIDTSGAFAQLSDARFKTDIEPLSGALERLMRLEPASYRMTMEAADDPVSIGLIAQQVSDVLPGAVSEQEGTLGVYYNQITALNTAALIELNTRHLALTEQQRKAFDAQQIVIEDQQARIAESEKRLAHLETENSKLGQLAERNERLESRLAALEALLLEDRRVVVGSL